MVNSYNFSVSLTALAESHEVCLVDSSILDPSVDTLDLRIAYREEFETITNKRPIYTVREVIEEARISGNPLIQSRASRLTRIKLTSESQQEYGRMRDYLGRLSSAADILPSRRDDPETDINLAAIFLTIARVPQRKVALLSSDRKLCEFIRLVLSSPRKEFESNFPFPIEGLPTIYSLIQRRALFVKYEEERMHSSYWRNDRKRTSTPVNQSFA